jgi:hypothetical protein
MLRSVQNERFALKFELDSDAVLAQQVGHGSTVKYTGTSGTLLRPVSKVSSISKPSISKVSPIQLVLSKTSILKVSSISNRQDSIA